MKILLTGGTGYLGKALCRELDSAGHELILLVRPGSNIAFLNDGLRSATSILDSQLDAVKNIDAIIHAATNYGKQCSPEEVGEANYELPMRLLEYASAHEVQCFLNFDTPIKPDVSAYAFHKDRFRRALESCETVQYRLNLVLQYFYSEAEPAARLLSSLIHAARTQQESFQLSPGEQRRDFVYIDDVLSAVVLVLKNLDVIGCGYHSFDVGSGNAVSLRELVALIQKHSERCVTDFQFGAFPYRENEQMLVVADISKLLNLGWKTPVALEEGLQIVLASSAN